MNPYDHCTFNKTVNGEQLTVQFHVDDLKASHRDPQVLENLMKELGGVFRKEDELTETKGKIREYLGLTIDYSMPGNVVFTMFEYLEDIILEAPKELLPKNCNYPCNGKFSKLIKHHHL